MPRVATGKPHGRPTKKNAQALARILKIARTGLPIKFAAQAADIDPDTLAQWCVKDPEFNRALSQARLAAVEERWQLIKRAAEGYKENPPDWRAAAWCLERTNAADFARPEVALNLIAQNNVTENHLTINITGTEATAIELQAQPVRAAVGEMFKQYRPVSGNGNAEARDIEARLRRGEPEHVADLHAAQPNLWIRQPSATAQPLPQPGTGAFAAFSRGEFSQAPFAER
jgi:hypothetical protein